MEEVVQRTELGLDRILNLADRGPELNLDLTCWVYLGLCHVTCSIKPVVSSVMAFSWLLWLCLLPQWHPECGCNVSRPPEEDPEQCADDACLHEPDPVCGSLTIQNGAEESRWEESRREESRREESRGEEQRRGDWDAGLWVHGWSGGVFAWLWTLSSYQTTVHPRSPFSIPLLSSSIPSSKVPITFQDQLWRFVARGLHDQTSINVANKVPSWNQDHERLLTRDTFLLPSSTHVFYFIYVELLRLF